MTDASSAALPPPAEEGTVELPDGRDLGYAAYGPSDGDPLLYFHGTPGSRYTRVTDADALATHGVRQVTLERPGFGLSTFDPDREMLDWPADVAAAADALGVEEFAVAGGSGGGPFTLACAARIPERLTGVAVLGGLGPLDAPGATAGMEWQNRLGFKLAGVPYVLRPLLWRRIRKIRRDVDGFLDDWAESAPEPDRRLLRRPAVRDSFRQSFPQAVRQGTKAPLRETRIHVRPWGFDLAEVPVHVHLWHGEQDAFAPPSMARTVADRLPSSTLRMPSGEGHLLAHARWDEILGVLAAA